MLRSSFCQLRGINPSAEHRLWKAGVCTWRDLMHLADRFFSKMKAESLRRQLRECKTAWERSDFAYFLDRFPTSEKVRIFGEFSRRMTYLDIETTGLSQEDRITTTMVLYCGKLKQYVTGHNLEELSQVVAETDILVTFNGTRFDLPVIRREFGRDCRPMTHLDLYPVFRDNGFRGGLKKIETIFGLRRVLPEVDGRVAVELWVRHCDGEATALKTLLQYNAEDVLMLERLAVALYNRKVRDCPLPLTPVAEVDRSKSAFLQLDNYRML